MRKLRMGGPWVRVGLLVARRAKEGWDRLTPGERSQFATLLKRSRGRRSRLLPAERAELRNLLRTARGRKKRRWRRR